MRTAPRARRTPRAVAVITAAVLLVASASTFAAAAPAPSGDKTGTAVGTGSTTDVVAGGAVDWTVTGSNTGNLPATVTMTDTIGTGQTFDPSGTAAPDGWTVSYSDTGAAGPFTDPASVGTRAVRAVSPLLPPGLLGGAGTLPTPSTEANLSLTEGDGWIPIVTSDRIFNVMHHTHSGQPDVNCTVRATGNICAGYPLELGAYTAGDVLTPQSPRAIVDDDNRLWIPASVDIAASTTDEGGLYCLDLDTDTPCSTPWYPLTTVQIGTRPAPINISPVGGIAQSGDRLYMSAVRNVAGPSAVQSLCFDISTLSSCGVTDMNSGGFPAWNYANVSDGRAPWIQTDQSATQVFFTVDYGGSQGVTTFDSTGNRIFCVDAASGNPCAGWTIPAVPGTSGDNLVRLTSLLMENPAIPGQMCTGTTVVDTAIINSVNAGIVVVPALTSRLINCFDATGANTPANVPAGLQALVDAVPQYMFTNFSYRQPVAIAYEEVNVGPGRTVIPMAVSNLNTQTRTTANSWAICHDTAVSGACGSFGTSGQTQFPSVNGGAMQLYGFSTDDAGCMWGLGDQGWLFSASPTTGTTPCTRTAVGITVPSAASWYCRTTTPTVTWGDARLTGLAPGDIDQFTLDVTDSTGVPIPGYTGLTATGDTISLAGLPGGPEYRFSANVIATSSNPWTGGTPALSVSFTGPPPELCLRTITDDDCTSPTTAANVADVTVTDSDGSATITTSRTLNVTGIPACPTSSTSSSSTSSTTSTSTTSSSSTSTPPSTTTTEPPSTTTTELPGTTTTVLDRSGGSATNTPTTINAGVTGAAANTLPNTGGNTTLPLAGGALLALVGGFILVAVARRRT
jgi:LPXTG-motif cell wall-anchored protein